MIQKLKRKFIIINMFFVLSAMVILLGIFFLSEYQNEIHQMDYNLEMALERQGDFRPEIGEKITKEKPTESTTRDETEENAAKEKTIGDEAEENTAKEKTTGDEEKENTAKEKTTGDEEKENTAKEKTIGDEAEENTAKEKMAGDETEEKENKEEIPKEDKDLSMVPLTKLMPTFTVELDQNGNLIHLEDSHVYVGDSVVTQAIKEVLSQGKEKGTLRSISLKYHMNRQNDKITIAFVDTTFSDNYLKILLLKLLFVLVIGCLIFLGISMYLARITVQPVEKAWNQQKQFLADASHELKTPLTVILANLDIINSHKEDSIFTQQKWIEHTKKEADRMKQLLEDLLFLARNGTSFAPVAKQTIDLSYLVLGSTLLFESVAYESKIQLEEEIEEDIFMLGDEKQLKQLMAILLDNACKYSKGGRVDVTLKKVQEKIVLEVKNEITQEENLIPPKDIAHIFERFYRVDKSRARKEGGYGLGLSIALTIVKNHQGKIKVRSSMEEGTIFSITFS